jgi:hypothetical protein
MELLGDVDHVKSRFGPFRDNVSVGEKKVHGLRQTYHRLRNYFGRTRWYFQVTRLRNPFCTHQMELPGEVGHVEPHFSLFGDSVSVSTR